jgi:simple sugar transport system ATP-binding protein
MTGADLVLSLRGVTKRFGALLANDAIDLDLRGGEILALLGENGAGKTTLMNILFGHYVADGGSVHVARTGGALKHDPEKWTPLFGKGHATSRELERDDGSETSHPALEALAPGSPRAALAAGIGMVHQHFALAESLTVLENIVLGTQPLGAPTLRLRAARAKLERLMRESGLVVRPNARVFELSVGEKQRVEILKVLFRDARILVLDEPTAVLTPQEIDGLFAVLRRLARRGFSIVFISHKLGEVVALADRVVVLRHGRKVADQPVAAADRNRLAALMVGREVTPSRREARSAGDVVLELDRVSVRGEQGRAGLVEASLKVCAVEIVGIAGVSGNGQAALAGLIAGTLPAAAGSFTIAGLRRTASPRAMHAAGVAAIPEDRHREGIVGSLSVAENLVLENLDSPEVQRAGLIRSKRVRARAQQAIAAYDVRCPGPETPIRLLSGGNIQKVILARALDRDPRVILANQPTRGLDVGASADVHRRLLAARMRGAGIVLISEDLDELLALCDRLAVMVRGRLTEAVPVETLTRERIGLLMAGQNDEAA